MTNKSPEWLYIYTETLASLIGTAQPTPEQVSYCEKMADEWVASHP